MAGVFRESRDLQLEERLEPCGGGSGELQRTWFSLDGARLPHRGVVSLANEAYAHNLQALRAATETAVLKLLKKADIQTVPVAAGAVERAARIPLPADGSAGGWGEEKRGAGGDEGEGGGGEARGPAGGHSGAGSGGEERPPAHVLYDPLTMRDRLFRTQEHEERIRRQQEEDEEIELRLEKAEKRALRAAEESQWELDEIARLEAVEREEAARALARERLIGSACGRSAKANARRLAIFDAIDTDRDDTITVGEVRVDSFLVYLRPIAKFGIVKCVQRDLY